jgi:hypothetical protein
MDAGATREDSWMPGIRLSQMGRIGRRKTNKLKYVPLLNLTGDFFTLDATYVTRMQSFWKRLSWSPTGQTDVEGKFRQLLEEKDMVQSYQLGVNSYIQKPVDFDQFARRSRPWDSTGWWSINRRP